MVEKFELRKEEKIVPRTFVSESEFTKPVTFANRPAPKPIENVIKVIDFSNYDQSLSSMDKQSAVNTLVSNQSVIRQDLGDYYYNFLVNKYGG
jgi:hypothetical protein